MGQLFDCDGVPVVVGDRIRIEVPRLKKKDWPFAVVVETNKTYWANAVDKKGRPLENGDRRILRKLTLRWIVVDGPNALDPTDSQWVTFQERRAKHSARIRERAQVKRARATAPPSDKPLPAKEKKAIEAKRIRRERAELMNARAQAKREQTKADRQAVVDELIAAGRLPSGTLEEGLNLDPSVGIAYSSPKRKQGRSHRRR
ncbi:MAG: hypothetical protein ACRCT2_12260 [Plesiomonas shigelloides]